MDQSVQYMNTNEEESHRRHSSRDLSSDFFSTNSMSSLGVNVCHDDVCKTNSQPQKS